MRARFGFEGRGGRGGEEKEDEGSVGGGRGDSSSGPGVKGKSAEEGFS